MSQDILNAALAEANAARDAALDRARASEAAHDRDCAALRDQLAAVTKERDALRIERDAYTYADAYAAYAAAEPSVIQKIVEAAKSGGYRSARMVADELIGAPLRAKWTPIREQGYIDACSLVMRLAAKES